MKKSFKIFNWIVYLISFMALAYHFKVWGFVILLGISSYYMIMWTDDKEKGRLR